jgi:hypothetical protein
MATTVTGEQVDQYLAYDCDYKACKYKDPPITWGELLEKDYKHFLYLLSESVGVDTMTFKVLSTLLDDDDKQAAATATRYRDTPAGKKEEEERYLQLKCGFKGKSNGKTWKSIKENNYSFFLWAVGNAMGRETKSFNVLKRCLKAADRELVEATPKGEVRPSKKQKTSK